MKSTPPILEVAARLCRGYWREAAGALITLIVQIATIGFVALSRAFRRWIGDADLAVCGALLYYFSASYLLHGPLAFSDPIAIAFVALAFHSMAVDGEQEHDRAAIGIGLWSSAAI